VWILRSFHIVGSRNDGESRHVTEATGHDRRQSQVPAPPVPFT